MIRRINLHFNRSDKGVYRDRTTLLPTNNKNVNGNIPINQP